MDGSGTERGLLELFKAADLYPAIEASDASTNLSQLAITSLTCDSRKVRPGSCFVAIQGESTDGAKFVDDAVRAGAVAVVSQDALRVPQGVGAIRVRDARTALARLAAAFYGFAPGQRHAGMKLIGVTGTNGKTTTCMLLRSILEAAGHRTALLGTIRYDLAGEIIDAPWTTPPPVNLFECLSRAAENGATHTVMEVSSHALAQSRCSGARFAVGVFTNLSGDHLDYHGDDASYADAKKRLFDELDPGATAVVNADDPASRRMLESCRAPALRFGLDRAADVTAKIAELSTMSSRFELRLPQEAIQVRLNLAGRHSVANALAAAAGAHALDVGAGAIRAGLESVAVVPGRLQRIEAADRGFDVFVDYAHTDDALEHVLSTLESMTRGRLICVFGCGGDRDRTKRPRMARVVGKYADLAVVTGDNPRTEDPRAIIDEICAGFTAENGCQVVVQPDRRKAIAQALNAARAGDTVLISGKGHEDYQIIGDKRWHFDDVEVVGECLASLEERAHDPPDA